MIFLKQEAQSSSFSLMMLNDLQVWASRYPGNGFCGIWILDYITISVPSLLKWLQKWRIWALYRHSNLSLVINSRQAFETEVTLCNGGLIFFLALLLHFKANTAPELNDSTFTRCWKQISFGCITVCSSSIQTLLQQPLAIAKSKPAMIMTMVATEWQ